MYQNASKSAYFEAEWGILCALQKQTKKKCVQLRAHSIACSNEQQSTLCQIKMFQNSILVYAVNFTVHELEVYIRTCNKRVLSISIRCKMCTIVDGNQ